jgi:hypothetical protein
VIELAPAQRELVDRISARLAAVVLGGSYARGRARSDSDLDIGVLYSEAAPFSIASVRALAAELNNQPDPVVTEFYQWGPWVNGGAWLTIGGQRVDLLYRSLEHLERTIADAQAGRFELHYEQQPPYGFFSPTYLGELACCIPWVDSSQRVAALKQKVARYPDALRREVIQGCVWAAQFSLEWWAPKFAANNDAFGTAGCLGRAVHQLVLALFALNERYLVSDKSALAEIAEFARAPRDFGPRVTKILRRVGATSDELLESVAALSVVFEEIVALCGPLYKQPY